MRLYPEYLLDSHAPVFSWLHAPEPETCKNLTVIVCSPLGHEYTHSHRSLKFLADRFATQGLPVYRFDFHGVGNSPGDEFAADTLNLWLADIALMIRQARKDYPNNKLCLLGLRFGATLASMASERNQIDYLVLWEPIVKGRAYIRELEAIARFAEDNDTVAGDYIESAGFLMSLDTAAELKKLDLRHVDLRSVAALLYVHDDASDPDAGFVDSLVEAGIVLEQSGQPGYADMMAEPHHTRIPEQAIEQIARWLLARAELLQAQAAAHEPGARQITFEVQGVAGLAVCEELCWYEERKQLFSVLCSPGSGSAPEAPVVILVNSGSVHHVGPSRIYCSLARKLAEVGLSSLRIDIEGLGDSCKLDSPNKNHPYQENVVINVIDAMTFLQQSGVADRFIIAGLCSGAYAAFQAGFNAQTRPFDIEAIVPINPLTFYWDERSTLEEPYKYDDVKDTIRYKKSIRSVESWRKLFSGKVSLVYLSNYLAKRLKALLISVFWTFNERVLGNKRRLAADLSSILDRGIKIHFIFSQSDPGLYIVRSQAKRVFAAGLASGDIKLTVIEEADHTFSRKDRREQLFSVFQGIFKA